MDVRAREAWQESFFRQGRFQTHYEPAIVRLFTDEGPAGIGDADMSVQAARGILDSLVFVREGLADAFVVGKPMGRGLVGRPALHGGGCHGVRWHFARPPVLEIEFEMDLQGVRRKITVSA